MQRDEYRRASLENWQKMASGWEKRRADVEEVMAPVREWLVRELAPEPGNTVLELAAGPGDTGFSAATRLGDEGLLITSDFSPEMLEVARRRAAELGLRNVEFRVLDATDLELEDDSADGVICRLGYMLMADPIAALGETRRVLRAGGRLVLAVWRGHEQNPWVSIAGRALVARGLMPPPEPGSPGMFTLADNELVRSLLRDAGFAKVRTEDVAVRFAYAGIDEYIATTRDMGGAFSTAFGSASEDEQRAIVDELGAAFAPFSSDGRLELPGVALVVVAS